MKNSLKLFGLSIILSIANISGFSNNPDKNYIDSENIVFTEEKICLRSEEGHLEPLTAVYSDEKGLYILIPDKLNQNTKQTLLYTQDIQAQLVQFTDQESFCSEDVYRELTLIYRCLFCGEINSSSAEFCRKCKNPRL